MGSIVIVAKLVMLSYSSLWISLVKILGTSYLYITNPLYINNNTF